MIKYFHELTQDELHELIKKKITFEQLAIDYPQPTWCTYPNAVCGAMGCNSLMAQMVINEQFCNGCDCSRNFIEPSQVSPDPELIPIWD